MSNGTLSVEKHDNKDYEILLKNVSFRYPGAENYALHNFNLKLSNCKRLAFVGMNGSGKTTMIKLFCPTEGQIMFNGVDIKEYNYVEYVSMFSVVF